MTILAIPSCTDPPQQWWSQNPGLPQTSGALNPVLTAISVSAPISLYVGRTEPARQSIMSWQQQLLSDIPPFVGGQQPMSPRRLSPALIAVPVSSPGPYRRENTSSALSSWTQWPDPWPPSLMSRPTLTTVRVDPPGPARKDVLLSLLSGWVPQDPQAPAGRELPSQVIAVTVSSPIVTQQSIGVIATAWNLDQPSSSYLVKRFLSPGTPGQSSDAPPVRRYGLDVAASSLGQWLQDIPPMPSARYLVQVASSGPPRQSDPGVILSQWIDVDLSPRGRPVLQNQIIGNRVDQPPTGGIGGNWVDALGETISGWQPDTTLTLPSRSVPQPAAIYVPTVPWSSTPTLIEVQGSWQVDPLTYQTSSAKVTFTTIFAAPPLGGTLNQVTVPAWWALVDAPIQQNRSRFLGPGWSVDQVIPRGSSQSGSPATIQSSWYLDGGGTPNYLSRQSSVAPGWSVDQPPRVATWGRTIPVNAWTIEVSVMTPSAPSAAVPGASVDPPRPSRSRALDNTLVALWRDPEPVLTVRPPVGATTITNPPPGVGAPATSAATSVPIAWQQLDPQPPVPRSVGPWIEAVIVSPAAPSVLRYFPVPWSAYELGAYPTQWRARYYAPSPIGFDFNFVATGAPRRYVATAPMIPGARVAKTNDIGPAIDSVDEQPTVTFDFGPLLAAGASVTSVVAIRCAAYQGVDALASTRLLGPSQLTTSPSTGSGSAAVAQLVGGMVAGVTYRIQCVALTSDGQVLSLWTHLPCVAPN